MTEMIHIDNPISADITPTEAVTFALYLGIIAPTEEKARRAANVAGEIASAYGLTVEDLEPCKAAALNLRNEVAPEASVASATAEGLKRLSDQGRAVQ